MKLCLFFMYLLLPFFGSTLLAQQKEFIFKNFTQEEGLPSNESYFVFEDSRHYIWIATDLGVARYNGNRFEQYNLPDNVVFKIKEDNKGRIWFFTHKGLLAYFENEKMIPFKYNDLIAQRIKKIHIKDEYIDEAGNITLTSALDSNYIIHTDGSIEGQNQWSKTSSLNKYTITVNNNSCFTLRDLMSMQAQSNQISLVVNRGKQKSIYDIPIRARPTAQFGSITTNGRDIYFFAETFLIKLKEDGTYTIKEMTDGILCLKQDNENVWVGMIKGGALLVDSNLNAISGEIILPNKSVTCINYDYEGGLWCTTLESGAYYVKNINIKHFRNDELQEINVSRTFNYNDSMLIYGNSAGLHKMINDKSSTLLPVKNLNITDLFVDKKRTLFCYGGYTNFYVKIIHSNDPDFKCFYLSTNVSEILHMTNGVSITSTSSNIVAVKSKFINTEDNSAFTTDTVFDHYYKNILNKPGRLIIARNSNVWIGCNDGMYKSVAPYDTAYSFIPSSALLKKGISCIRQMDNGVLVTGIRFGGVAVINDTGIIAHITEKEGLLSDKIKYLLPRKDQLWVATAKGISVIRFTSWKPLQYSIINIGKNDGIYNFTINQLIAYQDKVVAATSNGIYFIEKPDEFLTRETLSIPFYISTINYFRGDTSGLTAITLPYSKNRLLIKYNGLSFNSYETMKYLYRFDHGDTIWHSTSNTELLLENLEPGTYNLQIKAAIANQQRQSAVESLTIIVEKPWWQNNWLRLLAVFLLGGAVYLYITKRVRKIQEEEKRKTTLNAKLAELEQTALRSQMNPHFIFNCLTSIQQLIVSDNKTDANEYLVKFARLIRKTLELSAHPFISIREETEYLNEYLLLEQLRLSGHFEFTISKDDAINTDKTYIPNMMIQPVVENCIRHGIKSLENRKGLINIDFKQSGNSIACTVTDNGVGRSEKSSFNENVFTKHKSYGVDIVKKRLQTFSEFNLQDTGVEINDLHDADGNATGTQVILKLPYKNTI